MTETGADTYGGFEYLDFSRHEGPTGQAVLEVVIDRPGDTTPAALNAVDGTLHEELARLFKTLQDEREARAIVLTGRGRAFCAGGDFNWFPALQDPDTLAQVRDDARRIVYGILDVALPIVCAVNGPAVGLGASIALLCDTIFMAESATVADPHVLVGIAAGDGGTAAWPLAVGPARAKQYLLTGDPVSAREAERIGLVNVVTPDDSLHDEALSFAHRLASGAPRAVQATKAAVNETVRAEVERAFEPALAAEIDTFATADHREALAAIRDQRSPRFTGE